MNITYCPCKNGKRNTNCFPEDIVLCNKDCNKLQNQYTVVNDVHQMGITYLSCKKNNCEDKLKECQVCVSKVGTLNYDCQCQQSECASINNVCHINHNRILVCGSNTKYPLWSYCIDNNGCISSEPQLWNIFCGKNLSFVGKLFNGYAVIPKKSFQLIYFKENDCEYKKIKFEDCNNFASELIRVILNYEYLSGCDKKNDFKFVGFFVKCNQIYYAVQFTSKKNQKLRKLYILKSSFNCEKLTLCDDVVLVASYNIYKQSKCCNIKKEEALRMRVTGITYKNNELFVLTSSGARGYLWNTLLPNKALCRDDCNDQLLQQVCEKRGKLCLNKRPRGITHISNGEMMVICDHNECNRKYENNYYILNL